eukprot:Blabericola_migrator_1__4273@NODE_230_length_11080_cov_61_366385_g196_i0_p3_GENE_NODE_230_length_11080_cov_61_366385_g196_i0NODE_230_length_11080_cov_61_366385_g196_i0_p3_ORF_typecomplete_len492_score67_73ANAPC4_WD40/PF12894_7/2_9e02ANAPC4_WD40/PF12894_7/87ANAPC4_WD40/PF12894_7/1_4e02ANAPC4_WD40/PF12894_7/1_1e05WD40/PF00400_32/4_9e03WD40/PF00400_32/3_6e02WD40/PF00400_32/1_4e04WD40/PF00400_32/8_3WD40/PF00400_32/0_0098Gmad1/PF10647_9/2_1e03Gmad1/PF10647_9/33Gmad1/PF10647_9/2_6DPPIV_N/PF00930_21/2_
MRLSIGKINELTLSSNPNSATINIPRVPISSIAFQPRTREDHTYLLLAAGGSVVTLWTLTEKPNTLLDSTDAMDVSIKEEIPSPKEGEDKKSPGSNKSQGPDESTRWLHANKAKKQISAERIGFYPDHAPEYVVRVQWSEDGNSWASADGKRVIIFRRKIEGDDSQWQRQFCLVEPSVQEIFDFSLVGSQHLIIGGLGKATLRTFPDVVPEITLSVPLDDGEFVKGITARGLGDGKVLICLGTSHKCGKMYLYEGTSNKLTLLFSDKYLFVDGPSDHPGIRYSSIDPSGQLVAFAYGARKQDTFGALYDLKEMLRATEKAASACDMDDKGKEEVAKEADQMMSDAKYRVRGHQTRINCVAFGKNIRALEIRPSEFILHSKNENVSHHVREMLLSHINKLDQACQRDPQWPRYIMYAQASIEGMVSVWRLFPPSAPGRTVNGLCLTATPHSLVDQAGLITTLDWSNDDRVLAVGSDDGKLTCLCFDDEEGFV